MNKNSSVMRSTLASLASLICVPLMGATQLAYGDPAPGAEVVRLKATGCGMDTDCFTDINTLLNWTWDVRQPTAANPLLIDVGPGTFQITRSYCSNSGYVTLRGSGRGNTVITAANNNFGGGFGGVVIDNCSRLSFQDLTISTAANVFTTVFWHSGGDSNWTNVEITSRSYGWYDAKNGGGCPAAAAGKHLWFSSTITVNNALIANAAPYRTECGDSTFWGSAIVNNFTDSMLPGSLLGFQASSTGGIVHLYGSNVKLLSKAASSAQSGATLTGLSTDAGAVIHLHGSEVSVRSEGAAVVSVVGAKSSGTGSLIHGHQNNWGLLPSGNGTATRLSAISGGSAQAPFEWTPGTIVPTPGDSTGVKHLLSLDGQDRFVENDCPQTTGCQVIGSFPHTMVYRAACTGTGATKGPWYDTAINKCRGT